MKKQLQFSVFLMMILTIFVENIGHTQSQDSFKQIDPNLIITDEVIVRMHKGMDPNLVLEKVPKYFNLKLNKVLSKRSDIWLFDFDEDQVSVQEIIPYLQRINSVFLAQANTKVELREAPNDPRYSNQWQHNNIDSESAWDITTGGETASGDDIVVCVIESADVMGHQDLQENHWTNSEEIPNNGIDDDDNGYIDDYNGWNVGTNNDNIGNGGHGTQVAGMIGAKGNNAEGVAGANWNVKIMVVSGYNNPFTQANIIEAYTYPMEARILWNESNGAEGSFVVSTNASWGIDGGNPDDFPIWCSFYDDLGEVGILNCGATTNQSQDVDTFGDVPTACASDYMIGVTATDINDQITFAGYGVETIDIAAPGDGIYTTSVGGGYGYTQGTSFASPLTAGVIGLMYSIPCTNFMSMVKSDPRGSADIVLDALYNGVDQNSNLLTTTISGGRVNSKTSIDLLMAKVCNPCQPPDSIEIASIGDNDATINYDEASIADEYVISFQEEGAENWIKYKTTNLSFTFTELKKCTTYKYYIQSSCESELSNSSIEMTFNTTGCGNCIELDYCETGTTANPDIFVGVHAPSDIETEYINYTTTDNWGAALEDGFAYGSLVLVDDGTADGNEGCETLVNSDDVNDNIAVILRGSCSFSLKAFNAQESGANGVIIINTFSSTPQSLPDNGEGAQLEIPVVMISKSDGAALLAKLQEGGSALGFMGQQNEWINSFELDNNIVTSGDDNGYRAPKLSQIQLDIGQPYSFTMTPGFDGQNLPEYTRIWIDLNQNGAFDPEDLIYDEGAPSIGALTDKLTIPNSAKLGSTRMRVQLVYQGHAANPLPPACGDYTSGETEDFCLNINEELTGVKVYPNPTNNILNFEINPSEANEIIICDLNGKIITSSYVTNKITTFDLKKFSSGLYVYYVKGIEENIIYSNKISVIK